LVIGETANGTATKFGTLANYNLDLFIDWDQNGVFAETERIKAVLAGTSGFTYSITPPNTAELGATRLRARMVQNDVPNACGSALRGDLEDYTVTVVAPVPECTRNNVPANVSTNICSNTSITWAASLTGSVPEGYKVYFGTTTAPPLVSTQTATTYNPGVLLPDTTYYYQIVPYNATGDATG